MYAIQLYNFNLMKYAIQLYNFNLMKSINLKSPKIVGSFFLHYCIFCDDWKIYVAGVVTWRIITMRDLSVHFQLSEVKSFSFLELEPSGGIRHFIKNVPTSEPVEVKEEQQSCCWQYQTVALWWRPEIFCSEKSNSCIVPLSHLWLSLIIDQ